NDSTPMIVRIARVKVGNRQAPHAVTSRTPVSPEESRGSGVGAQKKRSFSTTRFIRGRQGKSPNRFKLHFMHASIRFRNHANKNLIRI
ncbi:hypothetical protein, partial [Paraburkholderia heleia]|uniref:hypothetical protein n=1 Tax=Paraburkholderia heleia TaxID=634127 RepID=UPI0031E16CAA